MSGSFGTISGSFSTVLCDLKKPVLKKQLCPSPQDTRIHNQDSSGFNFHVSNREGTVVWDSKKWQTRVAKGSEVKVKQNGIFPWYPMRSCAHVPEVLQASF